MDVHDSFSSEPSSIHPTAIHAVAVGVQTDLTGNNLQSTMKKYQRRIKILQQRLRRRQRRITDMKGMLLTLKENGEGNESLLDVMEGNFNRVPAELLKNEINNSDSAPSRRRYTAEIRKFALTLHFYSAKAYEFLRSNLHLPHPATLRSWLSSRHCNVGILSEVLAFLKEKVLMEEYSHLRNVALIFDSMAIRKELLYDRKEDVHRGYVDLGEIMPASSEALATEALVFQIVSYQKHFRCPVAYFFTDKINAEIQSQLLRAVISELSDVGVTVRSLTCDGTASNFKTYELLGCSFKPENLKTCIQHPGAEGIHIHCIFDPCHMLKLCRNAFAEIRMKSKEKGEISFHYVKELHKIQEAEGFKLANKLSACHVNFTNKKMNVRLAAQTVSSGVADALAFLMESGNPAFLNCNATIHFIRTFDRIFDVMNARNCFGTGYKSPMSLQNRKWWEMVFKETADFILNDLMCEEGSILIHPRKTFALGFLVNISSYKNLAADLLEGDQPVLKYFLPYKTSQDHVEIFFSCIRSRGGWNNNPNVMQFQWSMRKLLFRNSVTASKNANVAEFENEEFNEMGCVFEVNHGENIHKQTDQDHLDFQEINAILENSDLSDFKNNVLYYISGCIARSYFEKYDCEDCRSIILTRKSSNDHSYCVDTDVSYSAFTSFVSRGKLYFVAKEIFQVIQMAEKVYQAEIQLGYLGKKNFKTRIMMACVENFFIKCKGFSVPHPVVNADIFTDSHEIRIVKFFVSQYCNTRIYSDCKKKTLNVLGNRATLRQKLHNSILFYHV